MKIIIDVDALVKLAHWDLLDCVTTVFQVEWEDIATLSSVRARAKKAVDKPDGKLFHSSEAAQRVVDVTVRMKPLPEPDAVTIEMLQDNPQIDPGEAILFAAAVNTPSCLVITGDKRAIKAMGALKIAALDQRVVCLEQVVHAGIEPIGIHRMRDGIRPHVTLDRAIGASMGSRLDAPPEAVVEGLRSYTGSLRQECGEPGPLHPGPPFD